MGNYGEWKKSKEKGKPGEIEVLNILQDHKAGMPETTEEGKVQLWSTKYLCHIDKYIESLEIRGADIVQIEKLYQKGEGPVMYPTGRRRITFHEVKADYDTFGKITPRNTETRESAQAVVEQLVSQEDHGIVAGSGNVFVEIYGNSVKGHTQIMYDCLLKEANPFENKEAGSYWKYKKVMEETKPNNPDIEFQNKIWWCMPQSDGKEHGATDPAPATDRPHFAIGMMVSDMVKRVEKKIVSGTGRWKGPGLLIPLDEIHPNRVEDMNLKGFGGIYYPDGDVLERILPPFGVRNPTDVRSLDLEILVKTLQHYGILPYDS